jgi:deoxyribose-phosphate aldolase
MMSIATTALGLLDLTSLNDGDSDESIRALAQSAATPFGAPAALCVYDRFLGTARAELDRLGLEGVRLATVANFPLGGSDLAAAIAEAETQPAKGADEVDLVFPWRALIAGDRETGAKLVAGVRAALPADVTLKVIIESGELAEPALIRRASEISIENGADFVKTSTGKVPVNATLEAAEIILGTIRASGRPVGFKASGGVRTVTDAGNYLALADKVMGKGWVSPKTFRFGASGLLGDIKAVLSGGASSHTGSAY